MTKQHSLNCVAAKARRRLAAPVSDQTKQIRFKVRRHRAKAKWLIQVRDLEHGDSLTIRLYPLPWPARFAGSDGHEHSVASIEKVVHDILTQAP